MRACWVRAQLDPALEAAGGETIGFGAATAGTKAIRIPTTGNRGMLGKAKGRERDGQTRDVEGAGECHGQQGNESRARHHPFRLAPRIRAVARPRRAAPPDGESDPAEDGGDGQDREAQPEEGTSVNDAVGTDCHQQQAAEGRPTGQPSRRLPDRDAPAIAPGVHARRQLERAVQRAFQHRDGDTPHAA